MLTKERNPRTFPRAKTHIISSGVASLSSASPREGNLGTTGTTEIQQKLPADSLIKASARDNPPYWKKAKVEAFVNTCTFRSLFQKAIVKKVETCIESLKLHLTPKWIRQEKESLSTVQRGLFRSKMKRVSTAVHKANSPVHYPFIIMFFLSFPILNRRVDYAESESQQICSWQTVRILYLFNSLVNNAKFLLQTYIRYQYSRGGFSILNSKEHYNKKMNEIIKSGH